MHRLICTRLGQLGILPVGVRICFAILLATAVLGQTVGSPPAFETASVKLNTGGAAYYYAGPGHIEIRNFSLKIFIFMAYEVSDYSFSGPDWLDSVRLDVVAKMAASAAGLSPRDRGHLMDVMLQGLLAERFKLKVHREEKVMPGYALVVAPGGPKMRRVETPTRGAVTSGSITGESTPIVQIVASARGAVGRPVRDMTGLSGNYEVILRGRLKARFSQALRTRPRIQAIGRPPSLLLCRNSLGSNWSRETSPCKSWLWITQKGSRRRTDMERTSQDLRDLVLL